jgi:enoyl-CoA hydratase/carnithine racemase
MSPEERRQAFAARRFRRLFERAQTRWRTWQATIAMINGHAVGGGWGLTWPATASPPPKEF